MDTQILLITAISIGFIHTLIGPDHYLPFILIGRSRGWAISRTLGVVVLCGIGHVLGSVILGLLGVSLGLSVGFLKSVEAVRGDIASWMLIGFGLAYAMWGLRLVWRARRHSHSHEHNGPLGTHSHTHHHLGRHLHVHGDQENMTPGALFVIFVLGPCEPLIPILMYPAAEGSWGTLVWVTLAFGATTVATMTGAVFIASKGLLRLRLGGLEVYTHAMAGVIIALSGLSLKLFGL